MALMAAAGAPGGRALAMEPSPPSHAGCGPPVLSEASAAITAPRPAALPTSGANPAAAIPPAVAPAPPFTAPLAPLPLPAGLRWRDEPRLAELFRQAGRPGTFVLLDARRGELLGSNRDRALTRYTPASTFKIPNSLIGLSVGAVASVDTVLPYRSDAPPFSPAWEKDMGLREAIVVSNVPIYQELARRIGLERMREAVNRLDYGNRQIGDAVDQFWLRGPLAISAVEQTRFLDRLARGVLPFPAGAQRAVREITVVERGPGWVLHAKTGWQNGPNPGVGWWVGWVEKGGRTYPFALNLDIRQRADGELRQQLGRAALELLGVLPAAQPPAAAAGSRNAGSSASQRLR
jgi:beta-lactamase class D